MRPRSLFSAARGISRPASAVLAAAALLSAPRPLLAQSLADLWTGSAAFQPDTASGPYGNTFGMHFLSARWQDGRLWTYYITNYDVDNVHRSATGLALSADGINFADQGTVLDIGGAWQWIYDAKTDLSHSTGQSETDGWSASTAAHSAGYLCYGPYATDIAPGANTASFQLLIDNNSADSLVVATIEVWDATSKAFLAQRELKRTDFTSSGTFQTFNLNFIQTAGHATELRTYWHDKAYLKQKLASVSQGQSPFFDDRLASFPGIWKDGATWYLVYEGAGTDGRWPGDVGLATSSDGIHWIKSSPNPILTHQASGWEKVNIGTPSLWKEGSTWYLFYHGFDGTDVQIGVATGTDLKSLTRYGGNPILRTGSNGAWDSGTAGKRSIWKEGSYYYMAYEGSTEQPYDTAQWSSGLARSTDLLHWEKFSGNPVLPQTSPGAGFGYDGPEFIQTPDSRLHIYYRANGPGNLTRRATLTRLIADADEDGVSDASDNCRDVANADQADSDGDDVGDVCDCAPDDQAEPGTDGECATGCSANRTVDPFRRSSLALPGLLSLGLALIAFRRRR